MSRDLSELLVSLALGALVITGALQMHAHFTQTGARQKELAESQQSLRVGMRLVSAAVRNAGSAVEWSGGRLRLAGTRSVEFRVENGHLMMSGAPVADLDELQVTPLCAKASCDLPQALRVTLGARGSTLTEVIALRNVS